MENVYKQQAGFLRLRALAIWEWLMVLPASVLLAAAALRLLQSRQYELARTSWIIFEWTVTHVSRLGAAILFIGMLASFSLPVAPRSCETGVRIRRCVMTRQWHLRSWRRHFAFGLLTAAVLLAGAILPVVAVHMVTD